MTITVTATTHPVVEKIKYPTLGIYPDGTIVLFSDVSSGTILQGVRKQSKVGYHTSAWADYRDAGLDPSAKWVPYHGTITLSNETV